MTDGITLTLTPAERGAVAHELRRYGNYRRGIGDDLWDSAITPEAGEPDPPDITPKVEQMVDIHLGFAERCESLAAAFESDEPMVSLDRSAPMSSGWPWRKASSMSSRPRLHAQPCCAAS
ncbi:hypothetical protein ABH903_000767 [Brevibacterium epidermidis]|uniref:Uncharacterized protein n=1 Tax=Brevibacterium epidermidis TaxID=1698 RepID=A0ABV4EHK9_BREEP